MTFFWVPLTSQWEKMIIQSQKTKTKQARNPPKEPKMWKLHNLWKAYTQNVSYFASIILVLFSDNKNKDLEIKHIGRVMCEDIPPAIVIKWVGMEAMTPTIPQWTLPDPRITTTKSELEGNRSTS